MSAEEKSSAILPGNTAVLGGDSVQSSQSADDS